MTNEQNQFLTEKMNLVVYRDFSTWENYGRLLQWSKQQDWWKVFCDRFTTSNQENAYIGLERFSTPETFATELYDFLYVLSAKNDKISERTKLLLDLLNRYYPEINIKYNDEFCIFNTNTSEYASNFKRKNKKRYLITW